MTKLEKLRENLECNVVELKEAFLGSTSNYVLHTSKIPVTIVK